MPSQSGEPGIVRVAGWEQFPWLRAGFSTRTGGESVAYGPGDLNLGWTASDPPETVAANRALLLRAAGGTNEFQLATLSQFHSATTHVIEQESGPVADAEGKPVLRGDGLLTATHGIMLGIQTADCVPVLVADTQKRVVGAFHAGWRGTLARIMEHGVAEMTHRFGSAPGDLVAAIGPCIGPCCFAVGEDVRTQFANEFGYAGSLCREGRNADEGRSQQIYMDLVEANRRQLLDAGLRGESITALGECTACTRLGDGKRKYFSHRAESGFTGRMMSVIGVAAG